MNNIVISIRTSFLTLYYGHDDSIYTGYLGYTLISVLKSEYLVGNLKVGH